MPPLETLLIDSHPPLAANDIAVAQMQMGLELPEDLRTFYLQHNGGRPEKRLFRRGDNGFLVDYFLPLLDAPEGPTCSVTSIFKIWSVVGSSSKLVKSIPIAYDIAGDNLLYSLDTSSSGAIFCAWSDAEPEHRIRYLCGSLTEFLAELQDWS